ncbi:hypothetical protein LSH36_669g01004 [Paralvinella palmiformis]|uniref:Uncharacterized protein n=1 Tax=Paralvinella palmiformis TaxID=53620 RepID=A0AAD9J4Q1_9ANNE|nr:hypothetical protein LSH36_669g01004 [Paralvinella palmiformis]
MEPVKVTDEALLQRIIQHKKIQHHITLQPTNHNYRQFDLDHAKKDSKQRRNEHELWVCLIYLFLHSLIHRYVFTIHDFLFHKFCS